MRTKRVCSGIAVVAVLGALAMTLSGCLIDDVTVRVRYDAGGDEFRILTIYEHFRSSPNGAEKPQDKAARFANDFAGLKKIWDSREHFIPVEPSIFGTPTGVTLTPDHKSVTDTERFDDDPKVAWEQIKIIPGKLFKDADGGVGYHHEVRVPGKVADQLLQLAVARLARNEALVASLKKELAARPDGKPRRAWDALRKETVEEIEAGFGLREKPVHKEGEPEFGDKWLECLEKQSIEMLVAAIEKKTLVLSRQGAVLRLVLPLSINDTKGTGLLYSDVAKLIWKEAERDGKEPEMRQALRNLLKPFDDGFIVAAGDGGIEVKVDVPLIWSALAAEYALARKQAFAKDAQQQADAKEMATRAAGELPVAGDVKVDELLRRFAQD